MKTYICVGIGDMIFLDSILTKEEKETITEIYWGCRFGEALKPLLDGNPDYPNLTNQHTIDEEAGRSAMERISPGQGDFWHFRPDFPANYRVGLELFGLNEDEVQAVDAVGCFEDSTRPYVRSSFVSNANKLDIDPYIFFHYPTSTRPRTDIAKIDADDWAFISELSRKENLKVIIVSDCEVNVPLLNYELLIKPDIKHIVELAASCSYYVGCDSFGAHLSSKVLSKEKLFIKLSPNFTGWNTWLSRAFLPHPLEDVKTFYKPYIGRP